MKPILLICFFLSLQGLKAAESDSIVWDRTHYELDTITKGTRFRLNFKVKNNSTRPLTLENIVVSCNCMSSNFKEDPIAPGDSFTIKIQYEAKGWFGNQYRTVTVYTDHGFYELTIHAFLRPREDD